ncbi:MAG: hypothetical protein Q7U88_17150 [Desulfocapsaceae bacterium]|nr:hypothetical protein [Desulfocapsaceae bacterium]
MNQYLTEKPREFLDTLESPTLLMQTQPRQVVTANNKACELFGKTLEQIEGHRGGQVFDCIHAFTEAGCGLDVNCENCKIKNSVVDTFSTGNPHYGIKTILNIKKHGKIIPHEMQVTTKKIGDFAIITIEKYKMTA